MQTYKSKVFKQAHNLKATTGKAFAVCLSKAWALYRLTKKMHNGIVNFAYEKVDGSLRKASGTLKNIESLIKGTGTSAVSTVKYFDIDANAFRSFRLENLVTIY